MGNLSKISQFSWDESKIFIHMLNLSQKYKNIISLGRGDPDLPTPKYIIDETVNKLVSGETKYTPPEGLFELRSAIVTKLNNDNNLNYKPSNIIVTNGAQEAIFITLMSIISEGDEVLLPDPYYMAHRQAIEICGGKSVLVKTLLEEEFVPEPKRIESLITEKTKAIILSSPCNPTGAVIDKKTAKSICDIIKKYNLILISDELYEKIYFNNNDKYISFASFDNMHERTITINGFSKFYNMTGFRVGYLVANENILKNILELHHLNTICAPTISQWAALKALDEPRDYRNKLLSEYQQRRKLIFDFLTRNKIPHNKSEGAFFIFVDIRKTKLSSLEFCEKLLEQKNILIFPGSQYGSSGEGFVRMSFLISLNKLEIALNKFISFYNNNV